MCWGSELELLQIYVICDLSAILRQQTPSIAITATKIATQTAIALQRSSNAIYESITVGLESGEWSDRFHDFFDVLFRAVLDLLEFLVFAEFSKASFNHVEEFVYVLQKSCEFCTDLTCVQFWSGLRIGLRLIRLYEKKWEERTLEPPLDPHNWHYTIPIRSRDMPHVSWLENEEKWWKSWKNERNFTFHESSFQLHFHVVGHSHVDSELTHVICSWKVTWTYPSVVHRVCGSRGGGIQIWAAYSSSENFKGLRKPSD